MGMPREFVVFDTETTGMPPGARLIEIGAVRVRGHSVIDRFQELIFPEQPIPERVIAVHGIHDEAVRESKPASEVLPRFFTWLGGTSLIGHNVSFDAAMLASECLRLGISAPENRTYCTLKAARILLKRRSHSLQNLAQEFRFQTGRSHRASDDAETTLQLLWKLQEIGGTQFRFQQLGSGLPVEHYSPQTPKIPQSKKSLIQAACLGEAVDMHYRLANGHMVETRVSPRYFFQRRDGVIMEAFCHISHFYKNYRLERIQAAFPCPDTSAPKVRRDF